MKIVISPAKSLDFESALPTQEFTNSRFLKESKSINKVIKQKSPKELSELIITQEDIDKFELSILKKDQAHIKLR